MCSVCRKIPNNAHLVLINTEMLSCGLHRVYIPQYRMHLSLTLDCQSLRRKTEVITQQLRIMQCVTEVSGSKLMLAPPLFPQVKPDSVLKMCTCHSSTYILGNSPFDTIAQDEDQGATVQGDSGAV